MLLQFINYQESGFLFLYDLTTEHWVIQMRNILLILDKP